MDNKQETDQEKRKKATTKKAKNEDNDKNA